MSDLLSLHEVIPYAATVGGAMGGIGLEYLAQHNIIDNQQALAREWGEVHERQANRWRSIARVALGPLMAVGALGGFANGMAWEPDTAVRQVPPQLEVVVDHSAATGLNGGHAAKEISQLSHEFTDKKRVTATAFLARGSEVVSVEISKVDKDVPFGDAPLDTAIGNALDRANLDRTKAIRRNHKLGTGVLVLTNGNSIGDPTAVAEKAESVPVPLFIVNVEAGKSNQQTTKDLQATAKQTKGQYWDANTTNVTEVAKEVKHQLVPEKVQDTRPNRNPLRVVAAALSAGTLGLVYKRRREMTLGNELYRSK